MQPNEIENRILAALGKISDSECLLDVLAERIAWDGGIEKVFQGLFLWAFNSLDLSPCYYLGPELNQHDFLVFKSCEEVNRQVENTDGSNLKCIDPRWLQITSGYIEVKDIDNIRNPTRGLLKDIRSLRTHGQETNRARTEERFPYEMVLLKTREKQSGQGWRNKREENCWSLLRQEGISKDTCRVATRPLFDNWKPVCADKEWTRCSLSVLLISVPLSYNDDDAWQAF
jgi:hypothetical protein